MSFRSAMLVLSRFLLSWVFLVACGGSPALSPGEENAAHDDSIVCFGDPDSSVVCGPASDFWDCEGLPNGAQKCIHKEKQVPGGGGWTCTERELQVQCKRPGSDPTPPGGGGWDCRVNKEMVTCTKEAPRPPGQGAAECGYEDDVGTWSCTSPTPKSKPPGIVPGGGASQCFCPEIADATSPFPANEPLARVITREEDYDGTPATYARLVLSTAFNDNTYGANASPCWSVPSGKKGKVKDREFKQLVGSDAAELNFYDCSGAKILGARIDYVSEDPTTSSGYDSLCTEGGDGKITSGSQDDVLGCETSLAENLNSHGYNLTIDSPPFSNYLPQAPYEKWIYEVWYGVWVRTAAFGSSGVCKVEIDYVHASPACGGKNSIEVKPCPCP